MFVSVISWFISPLFCWKFILRREFEKYKKLPFWKSMLHFNFSFTSSHLHGLLELKEFLFFFAILVSSDFQSIKFLTYKLKLNINNPDKCFLAFFAQVTLGIDKKPMMNKKNLQRPLMPIIFYCRNCSHLSCICTPLYDVYWRLLSWPVDIALHWPHIFPGWNALWHHRYHIIRLLGLYFRMGHLWRDYLVGLCVPFTQLREYKICLVFVSVDDVFWQKIIQRNQGCT